MRQGLRRVGGSGCVSATEGIALAAALTVVLCALTAAGCVADALIFRDETGINVVASGYSARVRPDGRMSSMRVGGAEFMDSPAMLSKNSYLWQSGFVTASQIEISGNKLSARSDRASVEYECFADRIDCTVANRTTDVLHHFIVIDKRAPVASNGDGEFRRTPLTRNWGPAVFYLGEVRLRIEGHDELGKPVNGQQVVHTAVQPRAARTIRFIPGAAGDYERAAVAGLTVPGPPDAGPLHLLSPVDYQVLQRQSRYEGNVLVSGWLSSPCDRLEASLTGTSLLGGLPDAWRPIAVAAGTGTFSECIPVVPGGWYRLELRATKGDEIVAQVAVGHVGVGEVFVGAGQSNSTNCGQTRTRSVSRMVSSFDGASWQPADDPQPGAHDESDGGSFWPAFGDALYARYRVPVGVAVTGHGATSAAMWQPGAREELYDWMMKRILRLGPAGFRALLWHQGEADASTPPELYVAQMTRIIRQSNKDAGYCFPWFVAQASYHNPQEPLGPLVRAAQKQLWDTVLAMRGPDTDTLTGENRDNDGKGMHFSPAGLKAHGEMWVDAVSRCLELVLDRKGGSIDRAFVERTESSREDRLGNDLLHKRRVCW